MSDMIDAEAGRGHEIVPAQPHDSTAGGLHGDFDHTFDADGEYLPSWGVPVLPPQWHGEYIEPEPHVGPVDLSVLSPWPPIFGPPDDLPTTAGALEAARNDPEFRAVFYGSDAEVEAIAREQFAPSSRLARLSLAKLKRNADADAARILELEAEVERLKEAAARWVPVGERLPDWGYRVLVVCTGTNGPYVEDAYRTFPDCDGGNWCILISQRMTRDVTHWQPLPEPPATP